MSTSHLPGTKLPGKTPPFTISACNLEISQAFANASEAMRRFRDAALSALQDQRQLDTLYLMAQLHHAMNGLNEAYLNVRIIDRLLVQAGEREPQDDDNADIVINGTPAGGEGGDR